MSLKKSLLAAGLAASSLEGCAPPENTRALTDEESQQIADDIQRERDDIQAVEPFLEYTDPLWGLDGKPLTDDNKKLRTELKAELNDLETRYENGQVVVGFDEYFKVHHDYHSAAGQANGSCTEPTGDDYIVLPMGENADPSVEMKTLDPGILLHETIHYWYGTHHGHPPGVYTPDIYTMNYAENQQDGPYLGSLLTDLGYHVHFYTHATGYTSYDQVLQEIEDGKDPQQVYDEIKFARDAAPDNIRRTLQQSFDKGEFKFLQDNGLTPERFQDCLDEKIDVLSRDVVDSQQKWMNQLLEDYPEIEL